MRKLLVGSALLIVGLTMPISPAFAARQDADHHTKVDVCHFDAKLGKYVFISVDSHATKKGHTEAKGDVFGLSKEGCLALNG